MYQGAGGGSLWNKTRLYGKLSVENIGVVYTIVRSEELHVEWRISVTANEARPSTPSPNKWQKWRRT